MGCTCKLKFDATADINLGLARGVSVIQESNSEVGTCFSGPAGFQVINHAELMAMVIGVHKTIRLHLFPLIIGVTLMLPRAGSSQM